ncbi:hypothetical protein [Azospirillum thermophilum]|uniref:Uncharacterized protein n=1 Tax=Azospirillum thermophilum TaxID=2202148 RepID=A0A2S2CXC9_9PROT|nr:hypothetical protein [Azospirillum thermophilum]AWK89172.1 hypothetical protein DEW08_24635 [Azospirillum thermophilum]
MSKSDTVVPDTETVETPTSPAASAKTASSKTESGKATAQPEPETRRIDTMFLWNRLKRTDPKATKPFTRSGGFRGTQIDPTWRFQMMTEVFGPVGKGWGYEQLDWTIAERMIFICARVWYIDPETREKCFTGPQWGGTEMVRRRNGIEAPDDECFKMSMTDAVGKCLLQIGLAADVYMGQFDDSKYREESEAFYAAKSNPALQPDAIEAFEAEVKQRLSACLDLDDLEEVWRAGVGTRLREIGTVDRAAQHRITGLFAQKKAEILKREEDGDDREAA